MLVSEKILAVVLDLETTGLHPRHDRILEVGMSLIEITSLDSIYVTIVDSVNRVMMEVRPEQYCDSVVTEMHGANGLFAECRRSHTSLRVAEEELIAQLEAWGQLRGKTVVVGSSVYFDMNFLREHMPRLHAFFHRRVLDVSSLRVLAELSVDPRVGERLKQIFGEEPAHRAIPDTLKTIEELSLYLQHFIDGAGFWGSVLSKVTLEDE